MLKQMIWQAANKLVPVRFRASLATGLLRSLDAESRRRVQGWLSIVSLESTCEQLVGLGVAIDGIVDVGAHEGKWTRAVKRYFPEARVLMLEAERSKESELEKVAACWPGTVWYAIELVGEKARRGVEFHQAESGSSVLADATGGGADTVLLDMKTLDGVVSNSRVGKVDLLKIDTQGYELKILGGASRLLSTVELVLLEVSLIRLYEDSPLLADVVSFMDSHGFRAYDLCEVHLRPLDGAMAQVDVLFVRNDSRLVAREGWQ